MSRFVIAQIFGVLGIIFSVLSMQMKTKKNIMIVLLLLNLASALNFLFLDSISGSLVCFFAVAETFINYMFDKNNKKVHKNRHPAFSAPDAAFCFLSVDRCAVVVYKEPCLRSERLGRPRIQFFVIRPALPGVRDDGLEGIFRTRRA